MNKLHLFENELRAIQDLFDRDEDSRGNYIELIESFILYLS